MADLEVSVGLTLETDAFEQRMAQVEETLRKLDDGMIEAAGTAQQLGSQAAGQWEAVNASIQQAIAQTRQLLSMSGAGYNSTIVAGPAAGSAQSRLLQQTVRDMLSGISLQLDGQAVGRLVAPAVNEWIAQESRARRFSAG